MRIAEIISGQFKLLLLCVAYGVLLGAWYDFFRALRKKIPHRNRTVHMEDAVFVFTTAAGLFLLFQIYSRGEVRFYCFAGTFLGMPVYFFMLGKPLRAVYCAVIGMLLAALKSIFGLAALPVKIIVKNTVKTLKKVRKTIKIIKKCK